MVLAVAALLFQVSAVPPTAPAPSADADTSAVATVNDAPTDTPTDTTARPNFDNIKMPGPPSFVRESTSDKSISPSPLKTLAFNDTQTSQSLASVRLPVINPGKPAEVKFVESYPSRRAWITLLVMQHAAAAFDAYSTRDAVSHGAVEDDPFMRPFAHSPAIYVVSQLCPTVLDFVGRRMQRSQNNFIRHMWWLPQTTSTGMYLFSAVHNLRVAGQAQQ